MRAWLPFVFAFALLVAVAPGAELTGKACHTCPNNVCPTGTYVDYNGDGIFTNCDSTNSHITLYDCALKNMGVCIHSDVTGPVSPLLASSDTDISQKVTNVTSLTYTVDALGFITLTGTLSVRRPASGHKEIFYGGHIIETHWDSFEYHSVPISSAENVYQNISFSISLLPSGEKRTVIFVVGVRERHADVEDTVKLITMNPPDSAGNCTATKKSGYQSTQTPVFDEDCFPQVSDMTDGRYLKVELDIDGSTHNIVRVFVRKAPNISGHANASYDRKNGVILLGVLGGVVAFLLIVGFVAPMMKMKKRGGYHPVPSSA